MILIEVGSNSRHDLIHGFPVGEHPPNQRPDAPGHRMLPALEVQYARVVRNSGAPTLDRLD